MQFSVKLTIIKLVVFYCRYQWCNSR